VKFKPLVPETDVFYQVLLKMNKKLLILSVQVYVPKALM